MAVLTWIFSALISVGFCMFDSADQKIKAKLGETVTLPCIHHFRQHVPVQWSRPNLGSVYSSHGYIELNHHDGVHLRSRRMKNGDASLVLKNIRKEDGGTYECRLVIGRTGHNSMLISTVYLEIEDPPPPSDQKIKAKLGETVTLPCIHHFRQHVPVQWSRPNLGSVYSSHGYIELKHHDRVHLRSREMKNGDASLVLKNIRKEDGGTYECWAVKKRTGHKIMLISIIYLEIEPPPPSDQLIRAEPGQTVLLACGLHSRNPVLVAEWSRTDLGSDYVLLYRDEQIDPFNQHPSFMNRVDLKDTNMEDGDVSVVLKDVTTEDRGTYECRVIQSGKDRTKTLISIISLEVDAPTASPSSYPPDHINIKAVIRENLILPCRAENRPIRFVEWKRTGIEEGNVLRHRNNEVDTGNQHLNFRDRVIFQDIEMKDGNVSLVLINVMTDDSGTYEAEVVYHGTNREKKLICSIHLHVAPPPPPPPGSFPSWTIALLVIAAVLVLILIVFLLYCFLPRSKSDPQVEVKEESAQLSS